MNLFAQPMPRRLYLALSGLLVLSAVPSALLAQPASKAITVSSPWEITSLDLSKHDADIAAKAAHRVHNIDFLPFSTSEANSTQSTRNTQLKF
jgi:hypothetical protein